MKGGGQKTTLGAVAQIGAGNSAPQKNEFFVNGTHAFFRTSDAGRIRFGDIFESRDHLNDEGIKGLRRFPKGTILFPKSGASTFLNHRVMLGVDGYVSSHLATIVGDKTVVDQRFLLYFLTTISAQDLIQDHAYPSLKLADIDSIPVLLPPLSEQQRIVGILDEAFDGIATAKANAEKNVQNARALFESNLQSIFAERGKGWERVRIEDACESIIDCVNKTAPKVDAPTPFMMIRTTNVRNGCVNLESVNYVTEDVYRVWTRRQVPQSGDVILTREAPMGEAGMLLSNDKVFLGQRLVSYRANPAKLNNRFLLYALQSVDLQGQIHALASGATVQHMRVPDSKNLQLPLPGLREQEKAVATLDSLREETQRLESIYQQKLAALEELKKSLLHQAFNGQI